MTSDIMEQSTEAWNIIRAMNSEKFVSDADKARLTEIRSSCPIHTSADYDRTKEDNGICSFCGNQT